MLEVTAPARIDLGGGETDVSYISDVIGTCIVNTGIDTYTDSDYKNPTRISCFSSLLDVNDPSSGQFRYNGESTPLDQARQDELSFLRRIINILVEENDLPPNLIDIKDSLPKGTGLGCSSVLLICLVALAQEIGQQNKGDYKQRANSVIKTAHSIETVKLGLTGGHQDYVGAYFGRLNCIEFSSVPDVDFTDPAVLCGVAMESEIRKYLSNNLLVAVIKEGNQSSSDILNDQIHNYSLRPTEMKRLLQRMKNANKQMMPLLVEPGKLNQRLEQLGLIVNYCWDIKKQLSTRVGAGLLSKIEGRIRKQVLGLTGPGAGGNSLAIISREENRAQLIATLGEYSNEITLLFPRINETGIQIQR
jgi:galactokinase/mevalonate kinase-like predicted kinase